jgi:hypothetical protein
MFKGVFIDPRFFLLLQFLKFCFPSLHMRSGERFFYELLCFIFIFLIVIIL